jgi:hypothetical protein
MNQRDWIKPFLKLKDKLQALYETNHGIHHGVVIAPHYDAMDPDDYARIISELEASFSGQDLLNTIVTPGGEAALHAHYFFGDNAILTATSKSLVGIAGWVKKVPKEVLPDFKIPPYRSQTDRNLVLWTSIVYHLAWKIDSPYLSAIVEQVACAEFPSSFEWEDWPQPPGYDPRQLLIHECHPYETIENWKEEFYSQGNQYCLPEIIDAYLVGEPMIREFIAASLTAIDCLIYMMEQMLIDQKAPVSGFKKPRKSRTTKKEEIESEIHQMAGYIFRHWANEWQKYYKATENENDESLREKGKQPKPLTGDMIAVGMKWFGPGSGKPNQTKVSRLIKILFPPNGMMTYREAFKADERRDAMKGYAQILSDGSTQPDKAVYDPQYSDSE